MEKMDFNHGWTCRCMTRKGEEYPVTLPHDAMISEPRSEESRGEGNTGWYAGGDYEYRKKFTLPKEDEESNILIEFESVYHNAEVYLNGTIAAYRPYGYTNFYVNTKGLLKFDAENEIQVIVRNSDQPNSRWYSGAGIYRPVFLWKGRGAYIRVNGVKVRTVSIHPAMIEVSVSAAGSGRGNIGIYDGQECVACQRMEVQEKEEGKGGTQR